MALNVATLALILCRQVKTIKHGSVRINIVHFPIPCFLNFCSAVPTTFFSFLMIFLLVYMSLIIASCTPENIISKHSKTSGSE